LVKSPATINTASGYVVSRLYKVQKFFESCGGMDLRGYIYDRGYDRGEFSWEIIRTAFDCELF
jgi:hypothetical protein